MNTNKKIGILTLYYNNFNFGGMLQAYALQKKLELMGYGSEQIAFDRYYQAQPMNKKIINIIKNEGIGKFIKACLTKITRELLHKEELKGFDTRRGFFNKFQLEKIPHSEVLVSSTMDKVAKRYDAYIVGSDQVWNSYMREFYEYYFLKFVDSSKRKISYAASLGKTAFTEKELEDIREYIENLDRISVREFEAKEILGRLTEKQIQVVADPVLLLSSDEWDQVATNRLIEEDYIFAYFLGNNKEHRELVRKIAKQEGLKIVYSPYCHCKIINSDKGFGDIIKYDIGPSEFVSLIKHSKFFFTDSFHGMVFATIYHKDYAVLKRSKDNDTQSMNSRIYSFTKVFGLEDKIIDSEYESFMELLKKNTNYTIIDEKIRRYVESSLDYLITSLELG